MKKIYQICVILSLVLVAGACRRIKETEGAINRFTITAMLEGGNPTTKTTLAGPDVEGIYRPVWTAGDQIAIYADGIETSAKYTLSSGEGTCQAIFSGDVMGKKMVGLYPYSDQADEGVKDNILTLELPSVQSYSNNSFGESAFPMVAVGEPEGLIFKNLCAVLSLSMTGDEIVNEIVFTAADEKLCVSGKGQVRTDYGAEPELIMMESGSNRVMLKCGGIKLSQDPTFFYLVIPARTYYGGFTVEIRTMNGTMSKTTHADVAFQRSQLRNIPTFECVGSGEMEMESVPFNEIWYKTDYEGPLYISDQSGAFDQPIISNSYENGRGVLVFPGPVKRVGVTTPYTWLPLFYSATEVLLPDCVEAIGNGAFNEAKISSFRTPENLSAIGDLGFANCYNLERIYGKWASKDEKALILSDGTLAAYVATPLETEFQIPEGVTRICSGIFQRGQMVEYVTLPWTVKDVENNVFDTFENLREFRGESDVIYDCHTIISAGGELVAFAGKGVTDYAIPPGISVSYGLNGAKDLRTVTIPDYLRGSNNHCFDGCENLEFFYGSSSTVSEDHHCWIVNFSGEGLGLWYITPVCPSDYMPTGFESVVSIGYSSVLERLSFDDKVHTFNAYLDRLPNLRYLRLPSSLQTITDDFFYGNKSIDSVFVRSYAPPSFSETEWGHAGHEGMHIFVPEGTEDLYKSTSGWSNYSAYIEEYHYDDLDEPDYYISKDFSHDGEITVLQTATEGEGIDVILLGDAFSDRQIADGTYDAAMRKMMEALFSEEPYTTYRNLFNVRAITVVSYTEGYDHAGQSLGTWFGQGTLVGGNNNKCIEYARKVVPDEKIDNTLVIVAMNQDAYAGTCYMFDAREGDYGSGTAVAYFPISSDTATYLGLVRHEAGGHGFAKLGDEYAYEYLGAVPDSEKDHANAQAVFGWWKNIDFTSDPSKVKWAHFLNDSRYDNEGLGVFEGAFTYWTGVWRPTEESIMNHNVDGYNAPSREAIWYRLHKLAYGAEWQYNYEDFVAYDAKNRKKSATKSARPTNYVERPLEPTHPPVLVHKTWREAVQKDGRGPESPNRTIDFR
jgi:hypothetical protein